MKKRALDSVFKLIAVISVSAAVIPVFYLLFYYVIKTSWAIVYLTAAGFIAVGYGMQALYGTVTAPRHNARAEYYDDGGYEATTNPFSAIKAAVPIVLSAIIALISRSVFDKLLFSAYQRGLVAVYDSNSVYPFLGMLAVFGLLTAGIVMWFYPAHRLISLRTILPYFAVMTITFVLTIAMSIPTVMLSVSLAIYAGGAFIVLNQSYIGRGATGVVTAISNEGRAYNAKLMIVVFAALLLILLLFAIIFTGLGFLFKFIITYLAVMVFNGGEDKQQEYYDVSDAEVDFSGVLLKNQSSGDKLLIILCIVIFIAAVIAFLTRGLESTKRFFEKLREWIREIFMFFMNVRDFNGVKRQDHEFINYYDEEIDLQDAVIRGFNPSAEKKHSYREFVSYLNSLDTVTQQIQYAYVTLLAVFRELGYGVMRSETPRETKVRVSAKTGDKSIHSVTSVVESVDYAEIVPDGGECDRAIHDMCRIIENHFDD